MQLYIYTYAHAHAHARAYIYIHIHTHIHKLNHTKKYKVGWSTPLDTFGVRLTNCFHLHYKDNNYFLIVQLFKIIFIYL